MKTIIINGQRELAELPELWYTDGTDEANEWADTAKMLNGIACQAVPYIGWNSKRIVWYLTENPLKAYTYITPSEFLRLVYQPWKESQKVKLPTSYNDLLDDIRLNRSKVYNHINACIQLTNIMNFANDAFEGDELNWEVSFDDEPGPTMFRCQPIIFTSKAAAEWAYKTFPEIFKAYWNV
jgi:hypothetical protein